MSHEMMEGAGPEGVHPQPTEAEEGVEQESAEIMQVREAVLDWKAFGNTPERNRFVDAIATPNRQVQELFGEGSEKGVLRKMADYVDDPLRKNNKYVYTDRGIDPETAREIAPRLPSIETTKQSIKRVGEILDANQDLYGVVPEVEAFVDRQNEHYLATFDQRVERFIAEVRTGSLYPEERSAFEAALNQRLKSPELKTTVAKTLRSRKLYPAGALGNSQIIRSAITGKYGSVVIKPEDVPDYLADPLRFDYFDEPEKSEKE